MKLGTDDRIFRYLSLGRLFLGAVLLVAGLAMGATDDVDTRYGVLQNQSEDLSGFLHKDPKLTRYIDERLFGATQLASGKQEGDAASPSSVKVGLLDSGINPDHPQLTRHQLILQSFTGEPPEDTLGHGTAVAILMSMGESSTLYSARVTDGKHRVVAEAFVEAMAWMTENEVRVVNVSLGFDPTEENEKLVCTAIRDFPGLVTAAAGNRTVEWKPLPANCEAENVISVTNSEEDSGAGDIAAPIPNSMGYTDYVLHKGFAHLESQRFPEAIAILRDLVEQEDANAQALYYSAYAHFSLRELDQASIYSQRLAERKDASVSVFWLDALINANQGKGEETARSLEKLLLLDPENLRARKLQEWIGEPENSLPESLPTFFGQLDQ